MPAVLAKKDWLEFPCKFISIIWTACWIKAFRKLLSKTYSVWSFFRLQPKSLGKGYRIRVDQLWSGLHQFDRVEVMYYCDRKAPLQIRALLVFNTGKAFKVVPWDFYAWLEVWWRYGIILLYLVGMCMCSPFLEEVEERNRKGSWLSDSFLLWEDLCLMTFLIWN